MMQWAGNRDPVEGTRPAREGFLRRFERQVDPDGVLDPEERRRRAERARDAYMIELAQRSRAARAARKAAREAGTQQ
jgi:hypothetical protein